MDRRKGLSTGALASGAEQVRQAGTTGNGAGEKANDRYMASDMTPEAQVDQAASASVAGHRSWPGHEPDAFLGKAFKDEPVWVGLWESIRDVFFPVKLPPLESDFNADSGSRPDGREERIRGRSEISSTHQHCRFAAVHLTGVFALIPELRSIRLRRRRTSI